MPEYGSVVLTLSNVLLPSEKLYPNPTPSMIEGLPYDVEYDLRLIGCELIQTACLLLKLPQVCFRKKQRTVWIYFVFKDSGSYRSSIISSVFLFIIICSSSNGNCRNGLYKSCS
jgi:hypothetical protein